MATQETELNANNLSYVANAIYELYSNKRIKDYVPSLNKKRGGINNVIGSMFVNDEFSQIYGMESIESVLKKTVYANVQKFIEQTPNGIIRDKLNKGIGLLKTYIGNISANNNGGKFDDEIKKKNAELTILEKKYAECLEKGNFEKITDYQQIAYFALKLLSTASSDQRNRRNSSNREITENEKKAKELYNLVLEKFGKVKNEDDNRNIYNGNGNGDNGFHRGNRDNGVHRDNRNNGFHRDNRNNGFHRDNRDNRYNRDNRDNREREYVPTYKKFLATPQTDKRQQNYIPQHMKDNEYVPSFLKEEIHNENTNINQGNDTNNNKQKDLFVPLVSDNDATNIVAKPTGAWGNKINFNKLRENNIKENNDKDTKKEDTKNKKKISDSDSDEWKIE
jgi:hypothetical protein